MQPGQELPPHSHPSQRRINFLPGNCPRFSWWTLPKSDLVRLEKSAPKSDAWRIICLLDGEAHPPAKLKSRIFAVLPRGVPCLVLEKTVEKAFENLRAQEEHHRTRRELRRAVSDLETLNKIGVALSTERNTDSLLELILSKSREITSADAGSLYLVEEESGGGKHLVFKLTQNDSHSVPFRQFTMPIDTRSIAGYAAATGQILNIKDAYRIRNLPFRLNRDFDQKFGYRTKSMLVLPMKNQKDEVIGVLQLINSKKHPGSEAEPPPKLSGRKSARSRSRARTWLLLWPARPQWRWKTTCSTATSRSCSKASCAPR